MHATDYKQSKLTLTFSDIVYHFDITTVHNHIYLQSTTVTSFSLISNNRSSRSEHLVPVLTLVLRNPIYPAFVNNVDPDQLASEDLDLHCLPLSM